MNQKKCGGRDCIESIEKPGFCVWCDVRMPICPACDARCGSLQGLMAHIANQHPEGHVGPLPFGPHGAALTELAACGSDLATIVVAGGTGYVLKLGPRDFDAQAKPRWWRGELRDVRVYAGKSIAEPLATEDKDLLRVISKLAQQWKHR